MPKNKKNEEPEPKLMLVIRIRGAPHMNYKIEDTLKMLRLHKVNHAIVIFADKTIYGMLQKVKDYIAYGEIDETILLRLLRNRALLKGNVPLTEEHLKNKTEFTDLKSLAKALIEGKVKFKDIYNIKPIFRLHPPKGGFRGTIKKPFGSGGTLGNVGAYINQLAVKMI